MALRRLGLSLLVTVACLAPAALAQSSQDPDFLFSQPRGSIGFRMGMNFPFANSGIFDLVTDQLTLNKGDFRAFSLGGDLAFLVQPRLELLGSFEYMRSTRPSEMRDYLNDADQPILQTTQLLRIPLTATAKFFPLPRGESYGRYAWVPRRLSPYVGGGGGALYYRFRQDGDFVDFQDLSIFEEHFNSSGWSPVFFGLGGVEVNLTSRLYLDFQVRYEWAENELGADFRGFDPMDLSGLRATGGIAVRFD